MKRCLVVVVTALMFLGLALSAFGAEPDPAGTKTGCAADVIGASANAPTADDLKKLATNEPLAAKLADVVGHNRIAINMVWTLLCGFFGHVHASRFCARGNGLHQG